MSRLASFKGPSTPSKSPVVASQKSTLSPSRHQSSELAHHRTVRVMLQELRNIAYEWEDSVSKNGLKAATRLVDARTELDNQLAMCRGRQPAYPIVLDKLRYMEARIEELHEMLRKMEKMFQRMVKLVRGLEILVEEVHKTKGWSFVEEPLWVTWSLEKFASSIPYILKPYRHSFESHSAFVEILQPHDVTFEDSREVITEWQMQYDIAQGGWDVIWEDICAVEIDRWDSKATGRGF